MADGKGRIVAVNRRFEALLGYSPADLVGKPIELLLAARPQGGQAELARRLRLCSSGRPIGPGLELFALRADGTEVAVAIDLAPLDTAAGAMTIASLRDVSDRKRIEQSLQESRAHFALVQRVGRIGGIQLDLATGQDSWSEEIYGLLGLDRATAKVGVEAVLAVTHPEDREGLRRFNALARKGIEAEPFEFRVVLPDGGLRWLLRTPVLLRDAAGAPRALFVTYQDITERKAAEEEVRRSREHLVRAQRVGRTGSVDIDLPSGRGAWSQGMYEILGLDPATVTPGFEAHLGLVHADDRALHLELRARDLAGENSGPAEIRIVRPDGALRWLWRQSEVSRASDGTMTGLTITFQDITERKLTEEALEFSERRLREAAAAAGVGIYDHDHRTNTIYWSAQQRAIYGVGAEEPITLEFYGRLIHPDDAGRIMAAVARAHDPKGDGRFDIEARIVRRDGAVRWVVNRSQTVFEGDGADRRPLRTIGAALDVTDRRNTEEALRRSREHMARAQRIAHIGSAEFDIATHRQLWSDENFAILGLDPATTEPGLDAFLERVHPDDRAAVVRSRAEEEQGRRTQPLEIRIVRPGGEVRWVIRRVERIAGAEGKPVALTSTLQDITERKQIEEERASLERQLFQSQKLDALGQLAGGVAHDFNNLLAVILGRLEMAVGELADRPKIQEWVRSATNAARRGTSLTKMMLAFARSQPLQKQTVDPSTIARDMTEMLVRLLGETIVITVTTAPDQWRCEVDPGQLQNVILNLVVNARDAMPGGGSLTIATANTHLEAADAARMVGARAGDYAAISVADTGAGMPPEVMARAFEPFFTTKEPGKGTGLGLSMVNGFVRQSGGFVRIESEVGRGTRVGIYLPRKTGPERAARAEAEGKARPGGHGSILIIEDNDELRNLLTDQIEALGYRVMAAANASDGLVVLRRHPEIVLLLTDIVLPGGVDGVEASQGVMELRPDLRIIFMTGYSERGELPTLGKAKAPRLLRKPFSGHELAEAVRAAIEEV